MTDDSPQSKDNLTSTPASEPAAQSSGVPPSPAARPNSSPDPRLTLVKLEERPHGKPDPSLTNEVIKSHPDAVADTPSGFGHYIREELDRDK